MMINLLSWRHNSSSDSRYYYNAVFFLHTVYKLQFDDTLNQFYSQRIFFGDLPKKNWSMATCFSDQNVHVGTGSRREIFASTLLSRTSRVKVGLALGYILSFKQNVLSHCVWKEIGCDNNFRMFPQMDKKLVDFFKKRVQCLNLPRPWVF